MRSYIPLSSDDIPWQPVIKPLVRSTIALVTTAGVHHRYQPPFDMADADGDPSFREIDGRTIETDYRITHDYYDHRGARRDLNVVFPITRLLEMLAARCIGRLSTRHIAFMGHIKGRHVERLMQDTAPQAALLLKQARVDAVLLTPA